MLQFTTMTFPAQSPPGKTGLTNKTGWCIKQTLLYNNRMNNADSVADAEEPKPRKKSGRTPGRRPLAQGDADDTRRTIRTHAVRLFNERGYASVSVDDIAQAASLTRATLYYHYRGKADIFVESVTDMLDYVHAEVLRVIGRRELSVKERVGLFVSGRREGELPQYERTGSDLSEAMVWETMAHLSPRQRAKVTEKLETLHEATRALLAEGVENGELRPLPLVVIDYTFWQLFDPENYPPDLGMTRMEWETYLMSVMFAGVANP